MSSAGHKHPQATRRARLLSAPSTLATVVILLVVCSMSCVASGEVTAEGDEQTEGVHVVTGDELDEAEWDTSKTLVMNEASDPARTSTHAMPYHTTSQPRQLTALRHCALSSCGCHGDLSLLSFPCISSRSAWSAGQRVQAPCENTRAPTLQSPSPACLCVHGVIGYR